MQPILSIKVSITIGTIFEFGGGFDGHGGGDVVRKQTFSLTPFGRCSQPSCSILQVAVPMKKTSEKVSAEGVEVALNPDELDLDTAAMQAKYEQTVKEQQSHLEKEDLSDMVAEHAAKQSKVNALKYHFSFSCSSVRKIGVFWIYRKTHACR